MRFIQGDRAWYETRHRGFEVVVTEVLYDEVTNEQIAVRGRPTAHIDCKILWLDPKLLTKRERETASEDKLDAENKRLRGIIEELRQTEPVASNYAIRLACADVPLPGSPSIEECLQWIADNLTSLMAARDRVKELQEWQSHPRKHRS